MACCLRVTDGPSVALTALSMQLSPSLRVPGGVLVSLGCCCGLVGGGVG